MLSLIVTTLKPLSLSSSFLPTPYPYPYPLSPAPRRPTSKSPHPKPILALILPPSSSPQQKQQQQQQQQQLYQPFRPPPSPLPPKFRTLDTNSKLEVLASRLGLWFEYAPLIPSLTRDGFTPSTIEEITGITGVDQNRLIVAAQVRDSLVESQLEPEILSYFDSGGSELLYEIRLLNARIRADAARFLVQKSLDGKQAEELARAIKDFPRRRAEKGWDSFDGDSPGDCLAFMYFRLSLEYLAASLEDLRKRSLESALEFVESEKARKAVMEELERKKVDKAELVDDAVRVPVVRMQYGEVAEATTVVVFPVCRAEEREVEVGEAPWECTGVGEFGVVKAEKGWSSWVVLPGWQPVAGLRRGGVAVAFNDAKALPLRENRKYQNEAILVVTDRGRREVDVEDGFYLVNEEDGLKVERGSTLIETGVKEAIGTVVLVVRPPRDELDDQLGEEDWE